MRKLNQTVGVIGILGSAFAALCCIGASVLIALMSAIGAGFLVQDRVLMAILFVSLAISLAGLMGVYRKRRKMTPLTIGIIGVAITLISVLSAWTAGVYIGLILLLGATIWNLRTGIKEHRLEQEHEKRAA